LVKRREDNWIGHTVRRNCLLKHIIERKIEGRIEVMEDEEEDVSCAHYSLSVPKPGRYLSTSGSIQSKCD